MPPLSLLFYTHGLVGGGAERVSALLASGLAARGHRVAFAVDFEAEQNRGFLDARIPLHVLGRGHGVSTRSLAKLLANERFDFAYAAVGASNAKLLIARQIARVATATVLSAHGRLDAEYGIAGRATYLATALTSRLATATVVPSDDLNRYLVERFRADAQRVVTIPNPIVLPPPEVVPSAAALAARENLVVGMGRLVPEKGFDTLVRAVAQCEAPARLVILGEGPERQRLTALAASLGIADRVEFPGYVVRPWARLGIAKVLVLASRTEAFGNVLVEALAHGLPVVATRSGGADEVLEGGRHGRLVDIGDASSLAAAIDATLSDPGDPARHRAHAQRFALDAIVDRWEELMRSAQRHFRHDHRRA